MENGRESKWREAPASSQERAPGQRPPPEAAREDDSDEDGGKPQGGGGYAARPPTKTSIGIILCRVNASTGRPEVLLVHKRYTYAFAEFVHGRYARGRAGPGASLRSVATLFDNMTTDELLDVWSLNFEQMWYRIWLSRDKRDLYNKKYAKFQSTFMRDDGGDALRRAVQQARNRGTLLWEVPKGRRLNTREADILCAVREMREETGIDKSEYRILPGVKRRVSYVSSGTRYVCAYYVAIANPRLAEMARGPGGPDRPTFHSPGRPALREISHMGEVSEIRWHDIERVRLLDEPNSRLESLIAPAFRLMKQYLKGRWASRRHTAALPGIGVLPPAEAPPPDRRGGDECGWRNARRGRGTRSGRRRGSAPAKPAQGAPAKPAQNAPTKPAQGAPAKLAQNAPAKPAQNAPAKPAQNAPAAPDPAEPSGGEWRVAGRGGAKGGRGGK